jgi:probable F420-dependent oxidoreductase
MGNMALPFLAAQLRHSNRSGQHSQDPRRYQMKFGAVFPKDAIAPNPQAIAAFAQGVEAMGFDYLTTYDHVLGASAAVYSRERLNGPYRENNIFHEPFVLFGYLAGLTKKLSFVTGILILTQRQTALVAKQAAEVDVLSGGRLRLGMGTGWNYVEYEALGVPWQRRGKRAEEQIKLLRQLWTKDLVDFKGDFDTVSHAGINPLPVQKPIPIWLGGVSEAVIRRVATLADGWMPLFRGYEAKANTSQKEVDPHATVKRMREYAEAAGRDPKSIGLDCRITDGQSGPDEWRRVADLYRGLGATHVTMVTFPDSSMNADQHLEALRRMKEALS